MATMRDTGRFARRQRRVRDRFRVLCLQGHLDNMTKRGEMKDRGWDHDDTEGDKEQHTSRVGSRHAHVRVVPAQVLGHDRNGGKGSRDDPAQDVGQPGTSREPARVPDRVQMQVDDDDGQPSNGCNGSKDDPGALDRAQGVVVGRGDMDTIGRALDAAWVAERRSDSGQEDGGGNGGKEDKVTRVLQLIGKDQVRDDQDQRQAGRDGLQHISDKETVVQEVGLVVGVGLRARDAASAIERKQGEDSKGVG